MHHSQPVTGTGDQPHWKLGSPTRYVHHTPVHSVFYCPNFEKSAGALMPDQEDVLRGYCVIDEFVTDAVGLATFVAEPSLRPMFPIAEKFSELEMYLGL